jgi:hypothetical protein
MSEDCKEYNTLKYKTMITTGNNIDVVLKNETNETTLNNFLEKDITKNKNEVWSKLTKTEKIKKINKYIDEIMREKYDLSDEEVVQGKRFILMLLERKRLSKNNDLEYDKEKGLINNIDFIVFNKTNRKFLVNKDKMNSSLNNKSKTNTSKSKTKKIKEKGSKEN